MAPDVLTRQTTAQSIARDQATQAEFDEANLGRHLPGLLLLALVLAGLLLTWEAWRTRR